MAGPRPGPERSQRRRPRSRWRRNVDGHHGPAVLSMTIDARQLAGDEVADDGEPEAGRLLDVEALGQPAAVVAHLQGEASRRWRARARRARPPRRRWWRSNTASAPTDGKACSTAFCSSSARTTASGVATSAPTSPMSPVTWISTRWPDTAESSAMRTSDPTISSKGTSSPGSRDRISWTTAMDRTRRSASRNASWPWPGSSRRAWSRSSDEMVCRLFFTRWCTSRMAASLESKQAVEAAEVGDVAQQHHGPGDRVLLEQRRAVDEDDHVGTALHLLDDGATRAEGPSSRPSPRRPAPGAAGSRPRRSRPCGARRSWRWARRRRSVPSVSTRMRPSPTRGASSVVTSSPANGVVAGRHHGRQPLVQIAVDTLEASGAAVLERPDADHDGDGPPPRRTGTHSNCAVSGTAGTSPVSRPSGSAEAIRGPDGDGARRPRPDDTFPVRTASAATCQSASPPPGPPGRPAAA